MKRRFAILLTLALLAGPSYLPAQDAKDDKKDTVTALETRGNDAFNRGQFSLAKELFGKAAERVKEDKKRYESLQERIRVCEKQIKDLAGILPVPPVDANNAEYETAAEKRQKHKIPADGKAYEVPLKLLGNFDFDADKGGNIPEDVKKLTGAKVRLRGYMIPIDQADNISLFSLVPSLFACCFGQPPALHHQVLVSTPKGKAVSYFPDEIICEGVLKVEEKKEDGYITSVFELSVTSVKPAPK